ncbi:hypothetical protein ACS0Y7_35255 [Burkholderia gladioli]|uniref:hypothetical protein n=1 Tax=Burkholderia gladioli TaxID=28095 RepID=UPI003F7A03BA
MAALRERGIKGYVHFENDLTRYAFTPEADFVYPAARHRRPREPAEVERGGRGEPSAPRMADLAMDLRAALAAWPGTLTLRLDSPADRRQRWLRHNGRAG